jgi:hypothetical protein
MRSTSPQAIEERVVACKLDSSSSGISEPLPFVSPDFLWRDLKRSAIVVGLICLVFTVAAVVSLPEADDGSLLMTIHELGSKPIVSSYPENPLAGWIWRLLIELSGVYFWPVAALLNGFLWGLFGMEACYLWILIFPEHRGYAAFIGAITVAPIIVRAQTTLTISVTAVLSSILGYLALFFFLRNLKRFGFGRSFRTPLVLLGIAMWSGDYGLSVGLAAFTLLVCSILPQAGAETQVRSRRAAWITLAATISSYTLYRLITHYGSGAPAAPARPSFLTSVEGFPPSLVSAVWHVLIGAYGMLLGNFSLSWASKTSLVSFLFGILFARVLTLNIVNKTGVAMPPGRRLWALFAALVAGLTPVIFNHPYSVAGALTREIGTAGRLFIPVLPIAACLSTSLCLPLVRIRFRPVVATIFGLVIGFSALNQVWTGFRRQQILVRIGSALRPYVDTGGGQVVAVLSSDELCVADYSCTAKASGTWPADLSRHFWVYNHREALQHLGTRVSCKSSTDLHAGIGPVHRTGPISRILWVQITGNQFSVEPYCLDEKATIAGMSQSITPVTAARRVKGLLRGDFQDVSGTQDLTQIGTADWEHWTSHSVPNRKAGGGQQINYYNTLGTAPVRDDTDAPVGFNWSDGTPTEAQTETRSQTVVAGRGNGFQIAAPADVNTRTLFVYVAVLNAQAKMEAKLTDSSIDGYVDTSFVSTSKAAERMYKFVYRAGSPQQRLIVTFTQTSANPQGKIALQAAALAAEHGN